MHGAEGSTCNELGETRDEEIHSYLYSTVDSWGITNVEQSSSNSRQKDSKKMKIGEIDTKRFFRIKT